jgi:hypothetical protein
VAGALHHRTYLKGPAVTQTLHLPSANLDTTNRMIATLERHRDAYPFLDEDLARHRTLSAALSDQRLRSEYALSLWRTALARRWSCEVAAQRVYHTIQQQLDAAYGADPTYSQLLAPAQPAAGNTPSALLQEVRRLEAALALLAPRPLFADTGRAQLRAVADDLAAAIAQSDHCEAERRSRLVELHLTSNMLERVSERTRRTLTHYRLDEALL